MLLPTVLRPVCYRRLRGERLGLLELQTLWPFPKQLIREKTAHAKSIIVAEMNMGQVTSLVKSAVEDPNRVFLANRVDGNLITPDDIGEVIRVVEGRGL